MLSYLIYFISGSILITSITLIAEKRSPRTAGIMMTLPVITFLSLLFMAVSQGVYFSSRAAVWNPVGAIADLAFLGMFALGIGLPKHAGKNMCTDDSRHVGELLCGLLMGFAGYFSFILILSKFPAANGYASLAMLWIAAMIFYLVFKGMQEKNVEKGGHISPKEIIFRGAFGGSVAAAVVMLGDSAGYLWGGLFSAFPGTIAPVLILLHLKNGKDMSVGVIKSAPIGLSATGLYSVMVWLLYPLYGIIAGTLAAYAAVLGFLFALKNGDLW